MRNDKDTDNNKLFTQLLNESITAQSYLYHLTKNDFIRYGLSRSSHSEKELEEVYHDAYMKFLDMIKEGKYVYDGRLPIKRYFLGVFRTSVIDDYRKNIKNDPLRNSLSTDIFTDDEDEDESQNKSENEDNGMSELNIDEDYHGFEKDKIHDCLEKSLNNIARNHKDIIVNNFFHNQSIAELADERNTSEGYAKQLRSRAMVALRDLMFNCLNIKK